VERRPHIAGAMNQVAENWCGEVGLTLNNKHFLNKGAKREVV
jgi:hypothetical protein